MCILKAENTTGFYIFKVASLPNASRLNARLKVSGQFFVFLLLRQISGLGLHGSDGQAHIMYICAHTHRSPDREISQRLFKGGVYGLCMRVCVNGVGGILGLLTNCTDVDFLNPIHVSLNNLHIKYPPPAPPRPITGTHRRGAPQSARVSVCGLTLHICPPSPPPLPPLLPLSIFPHEIHSDLNPDMRDGVRIPWRRGLPCAAP